MFYIKVNTPLFVYFIICVVCIQDNIQKVNAFFSYRHLSVCLF